MNTCTAQSAIAVLKNLPNKVSVSLLLITEEDIRNQAKKRKLDVSQRLVAEILGSSVNNIEFDINNSTSLQFIDNALDLTLKQEGLH